jgi:hypothetical protein
MRVYPGTPVARDLLKKRGRQIGLRRHRDGPLDLLRPVFYVEPGLGPEPARLVRDIIAGDPRFFAPADEARGHAPGDHNYNDNGPLMDAIARGERGAYWDILRKLGTNAAGPFENP